MHVVTLANVKGGSGKTSTVIPLATFAARQGRTLLFDLDLKTPSASQWHRAAELHDAFACERLDHAELGPRLDTLRAAGEIDWVFVDTPAGKEDVIVAAMMEADLVVIPLHTGTGDVAQVAQTVAMLRGPRKANPALKVISVINHAGRAPTVDRDTRELLAQAPVDVAQTVIPDLSRYYTAKGQRPSADMWHFEKLLAELREVLA